MKAVSNIMSTAVSDAETVGSGLKQAYIKLVAQYNEKTHPKLRILDNLVLLSIFSFIAQIVYMILVRTKEPLNALMAGCFCSLGQFALSGKFFGSKGFLKGKAVKYY